MTAGNLSSWRFCMKRQKKEKDQQREERMRKEKEGETKRENEKERKNRKCRASSLDHQKNDSSLLAYQRSVNNR